MADPAPKKPPGPMRYLFLGCGLLTGLFILGMGSCAGIMYFVYKGTEPVAEIGADFLRRSPELKSALNGDVVVQRKAMGWNVSVNGDSGNARITYGVKMENGQPVGEAVVLLMRSAGKWEAYSARLRRHAGDDITVGKQPSGLPFKWDD